MKTLIFSLVVSALFIGSPAIASDAGGKFAVKDVGKIRCQDFTQLRARKDRGYDEVMGFVEGYMTAANRYEADTFDLAPWHSGLALAIILGGYCRANPTDHFVAALEKLVSAMRPIRLAQFSPYVNISDGTHKARVYQTILKRAEGVLRQRGLYAGAPDGRDSPELRTALSAFQKSAGLPPSGVPDNATLWKLLNP